MRCYRCGSVLGAGGYCVNCGADVTYYKRIVSLSNVQYNEGLARARIYDLSAAVQFLTQSLKYNKRHVAARNLLGLIYYEQGRIGEAITEWIVSSNIQKANNPAVQYLKYFEDHPAELEALNGVVEKYNQSLKFLESGNEDLAMLHLKKAISEKPRFVEAYQLMGLLCMKNRQNTMARDYLVAGLKVDPNNVQTTEYLAMVTRPGMRTDRTAENLADAQKSRHSISYHLDNETIIQPKNAGRNRPARKKMTPIRMGGILLCAAAIIWFLIVPAHVKNESASANTMIREYNLEKLERDEELSKLSTELEKYKAEEEKQQGEENKSLNMVDSYEALLKLQSDYLNDSYDSADAVVTLAAIDRDKLADQGKAVYDHLHSELYETGMDKLYSKGIDAEDSGEYAKAAEYFETVISLDESWKDSAALYHMGYCQEKLGNVMRARSYYEKLVNDHPDSGYVDKARAALTAITTGNSNPDDQDDDYDDYDEDEDE